MHNYYFNPSDYLAHTHHLTITEDCCYRRLIDFYYLHSKPIQNELNLIAKQIRFGRKVKTIETVLLQFFCLEDDNCWHHKRIDQDIEKYKEKADTNRENGMKGGRPKKPNGFLDENLNQEPRTSNQEPVIKTLSQDTEIEGDNNEPDPPSPPPEKPKKSKFKFNERDRLCAENMYARIKAVMPHTKEPNFDSWANDIRMIREIDKHELPVIWKVFYWANTDHFWCTNILSPKTLRKQFAKIHAKAINGHGTDQTKAEKSTAKNNQAVQEFLAKHGSQHHDHDSGNHSHSQPSLEYGLPKTDDSGNAGNLAIDF